MKITKPMTYGEFIDAMTKVAEENDDAKLLLEDWKATVTKEQWEKFRPMPLEDGHVPNFAEDMASYFQRIIEGTCGDKLYVERVQSGHAFLQAVHAKCAEIGIEIELNRIDMPLTPSDSMVAAGYVEVADGNVELTKKGRQAAAEVESQLEG